MRDEKVQLLKAIRPLTRQALPTLDRTNAPVFGIERNGRHEQRAHSLQL
jgi:hypothetical protein